MSESPKVVSEDAPGGHGEGAPFARGARTRPLLYGHRGTRRGTPENTLLALRRALDQGADGVELDVRLCGSGEVVVLHDPDLARVAGVGARAADSTLAELQRHDLGAGERVPRLQQALELVLGRGRLLNVELKADVPSRHALVQAVAAELRARPAAELARVLLSSFDAAICQALCAALPELAVALLFEREPQPAPPGTRLIHPHHALAHPDAIASWHAAGLLVNAWTVNDAERARALAAAGIDGLITDDVPLLIAALGQH